MAVAQVPEAELKKLIDSYKKAVQDLAQKFVGNFSIEDGRILGLVRDATRRLEELDKDAAAWAKKNIAGVYDLARKETAAELQKRGLSKRDASTARSFAIINHQAIEALVLDPELGFLSNMRSASDGVRNRLKQIHSQAKLLRSQQNVIDDVIARVGVLEGATVDEVKKALVTELMSTKKAADLVWKPKLDRLGPNHIFANLASLPYVKTAGGRSIRLDRYAEMVARTKSRQATGVAQRNALLEHGRDLVQISRNQSKDDDACNLYVGRVFALTQEAAEREGVPHVDQLPGGGAPFHPNCTHNEVGFFPELMKKSVTDRATTSPPDWALGHTWAEVQREYEKRGGNAFGEEQNPNMKTAQDPGGRQRKIARQEAAEAAAEKGKPQAKPAKPVPLSDQIKAAQAAEAEAKARADAEAQARKDAEAAALAAEARARAAEAEAAALSEQVSPAKAKAAKAQGEAAAKKPLTKQEQKEADAKLDAEIAKEEEAVRLEQEAEMAKAVAKFEQAEAEKKAIASEAEAAQKRAAAEAEAKIKKAEEAFEKAQRDAEDAKRKAEEDAADAKKKADAEAKAIAEAHEKELAEAQAKAEAAEKSQKEAEAEMARLQAEEKERIDKEIAATEAKEKAEEEAAAAKKAQEEAEAEAEHQKALAEAAELDALELKQEAEEQAKALAKAEEVQAELQAQQLADEAEMAALREAKADAEMAAAEATLQPKLLTGNEFDDLSPAEQKKYLKSIEPLAAKEPDGYASIFEKADAAAETVGLDVLAEQKALAKEKADAETAMQAQKNKEQSIKNAIEDSQSGIDDTKDTIEFYSNELKKKNLDDEDKENFQANLKKYKAKLATWEEDLEKAEAALEEFQAEQLAKAQADQTAEEVAAFEAKQAKAEAKLESQGAKSELQNAQFSKGSAQIDLQDAEKTTKFWSEKLKAAKTNQEEGEAKEKIKESVKRETALKNEIKETEARIEELEAQAKIAQEKADLAALEQAEKDAELEQAAKEIEDKQAAADAKIAEGEKLKAEAQEEAFIAQDKADFAQKLREDAQEDLKAAKTLDEREAAQAKLDKATENYDNLQTLADEAQTLAQEVAGGVEAEKKGILKALKAQEEVFIPEPPTPIEVLKPSDIPREYKVIRDLPGSTRPQLVESPDGKRWVAKKVKGGDPTDRLWNEVDADRAYASLGIPTPKSGLGSVDGDLHKFSEFLEGAQTLGEFERTASAAEIQAMHVEIRKNFAADALFGNWDVVGLEKDNILIKDGIPYRVDNGGALRFRAQGAPKGKAFGPEVTELRTLLDPNTNPQTASVFEGLTEREIEDQVKRLVANRATIIDAIQEPRTREIIGQRLDYLEQTVLKKADVSASLAEVLAAEPKIDEALLEKVAAEDKKIEKQTTGWVKKMGGGTTDRESPGKKSVRYWSGSGYNEIRETQSGVDRYGKPVDLEFTRSPERLASAKRFEDAIALAPTYEGRAFRGLYLDDEAIQKLRLPNATWAENSNASWSKSISVAKGFAGESVVFDVVKIKNAADFGRLGVVGEFEVIAQKDATFKVLNVEVKRSVIQSAPKPSVVSNEFWLGLDDMKKDDALKALKGKYDELVETVSKAPKKYAPGTEAARKVTKDKEALLGAYRRIDDNWQEKSYFRVTLEQVT